MAYRLHVQGKSSGVDAPVLGRITTCGTSDDSRHDHVFLDPQTGEDVTGYAGILLTRSLSSTPQLPTVHSVPYRDHLDDGDIVVLNPGGFVRTLFKRGSPHNALFTTDRCNSFCLMCSQPPKAI